MVLILWRYQKHQVIDRRHRRQVASEVLHIQVASEEADSEVEEDLEEEDLEAAEVGEVSK